MQQSMHEDCLQLNPDNINNKEKEKPEVFPPEEQQLCYTAGEKLSVVGILRVWGLRRWRLAGGLSVQPCGRSACRENTRAWSVVVGGGGVRYPERSAKRNFACLSVWDGWMDEETGRSFQNHSAKNETTRKIRNESSKHLCCWGLWTRVHHMWWTFCWKCVN